METIPNRNFSLGMASWQIFDISCTGFAQYLPILANSCLIFPISCTGLAQYLISQDLAQYLISQHLGEYLISAAQDLPTSSTPASSPQSRSSGNKFVSHTFNKAEKNKNWNSFSPLTKWRKEEMKISTGARQLWTVSGALWWKKPGEFSIKFFFTFPEQTGKSEYFCSYCLSRLGFLHQGCWIRWTAWTACIWRPETTRFCKPYLRTEQRTLAGPLQVFKKRLIRRHVDVSQSLWLKVTSNTIMTKWL